MTQKVTSNDINFKFFNGQDRPRTSPYIENMAKTPPVHTRESHPFTPTDARHPACRSPTRTRSALVRRKSAVDVDGDVSARRRAATSASSVVAL